MKASHKSYSKNVFVSYTLSFQTIFDKFVKASHKSYSKNVFVSYTLSFQTIFDKFVLDYETVILHVEACG